MSYLLFSLVAVTSNTNLIRYKLFVISILDGVLIDAIKILALPLFGDLLILVAIFSCSIVVLSYPIGYIKFLVLEGIMLAYVLLGWGVTYLVQIVFFNLLRINVTNYYFLVFIEGLVVFLLGLILNGFFRYNYEKKEILDFVFDIKLVVGDRRVSLKMLLDSGNSLYDELSGLPVIIVSKQVLENKLGYLNLDACRRVDYLTINGLSASLPVFKPNKLELGLNENKKTVQALIGVVDKDFKIYDGLLHSSIC